MILIKHDQSCGSYPIFDPYPFCEKVAVSDQYWSFADENKGSPKNFSRIKTPEDPRRHGFFQDETFSGYWWRGRIVVLFSSPSFFHNWNWLFFGLKDVTGFNCVSTFNLNLVKGKRNPQVDWLIFLGAVPQSALYDDCQTSSPCPPGPLILLQCVAGCPSISGRKVPWAGLRPLCFSPKCECLRLFEWLQRSRFSKWTFLWLPGEKCSDPQSNLRSKTCSFWFFLGVNNWGDPVGPGKWAMAKHWLIDHGCEWFYTP